MSEKPRILSGMQPTNPKLHLGNYEGALRNWVAMQDEYKMYACVVDWHSLTTMSEDPSAIAHNSREIAKDYVAAGLDPARTSIFIQSHVKEHAELHLLLSMVTPLGWLERVPTYKEKQRDLAMAENKAASRLIRLVDRIRTQIQALTQAAGDLVASRKSGKENEIRSAVEVKLEDWVTSVAAISDAFTALLGTHGPAPWPSSGQTGLWIELALSALEQATSVNGSARDLVHSFVEANHYLSQVAEEIESHIPEMAQAPYGLLGYPVLQAADILLYKPYGVPVGKDQAPHLEISREIARRFNRLYGEVFPEFKDLIYTDDARSKLPGLDVDEAGNLRKMSKSYDNCIYLNETADETAARIKGAFTTPTKMRKTDPGIPEGCAVCQFLKLYSPTWETQWEEDRQGIRGCMQNKAELTEVINEYLRPMREKRATISDGDIEEILRKGAEEARAFASRTMDEVRSKMGVG